MFERVRAAASSRSGQTSRSARRTPGTPRRETFGGFLLDPDGNSAGAVVSTGSLTGRVDHLWIRVAELAPARAFYTELAPRAGYRLGLDAPERAQFRGAAGSFSLLAGARRTAGLQIAFAAASGAVLTDPDGNTVELSAHGGSASA